MSNSYSATCTPPNFADFEEAFSTLKNNNEAKIATNEDTWLPIKMGTIASLDLPLPASAISVSETGSLVFKNTEKDFSGVVVYERTEDIKLHDKEVSISDFYQNIFLTKNLENYCEYLDSFKMNNKNYRVKITLENGIIIAYGGNSQHDFYIISNSNKNTIVSATIKSSNLDYIYKILKSIQLIQ